MNKLFKMLLIALLVINIIFVAGNGEAKVKEEPHKTFIIVVDRVLPQQLLEYGGKALQEILQNSSWAILSNITARGKISENQAITIGASSRAKAPNGTKFFNVGEKIDSIKAETIYLSFNNKEVREDQVFNPYVQHIIYQNLQLNHRVRIGKLGDLLKKRGLKRVIIGNSDTFELKRHNSAILMDSNGIVDYGIVDKRILKENPQFPGGYSTDYTAVVNYINDFLEKGDVFVIDTGDLHRLDSYYRYYHPHNLNRLRKQAIREMDLLFATLLEIMTEKDQLFILTLNSPYSLLQEGENIPVLYKFSPKSTGGLLIAPSTKRSGVVTNIDIAPTILHSYGIDIRGFYGSVMESKGFENHQEFILSQLNQINTVFNQRPITIRIYIVTTIVIVLAFLINLKLNSIKQSNFSHLILMALAGPLGFLIMPIFGPINIVFYLLIFYLFCSFTAVLIRKLVKKPVDGAILLSAITVISILGDTIFNSYLQKQSILGYDVIGGARFYGVGNEYMGVVIGGSVFATLPLMFKEQHKKWLYLIYGAIVFIMMAPFFGTNFGGTLALAVTFGVILMEKKEGRGLFKYILALGSIFTLAIGAMLLINVLTEEQTHIGRLFGGNNVNRAEEILLAITRKLSMNWRLVRFSIWSRIFAVLLLSTIIIGFYPPKKFEFLKEKNYYKGAKAILAGSLAAFFLNDSGIVAAATAMLFLALPLIYIFCCDNTESTSSHFK